MPTVKSVFPETVAGLEDAEPPFSGRNIVIFSDGTGQRGGLMFDERRSNIYKLYRATRCGPDTNVNPAKQLAFYDPGLGTLPGGIDSPAALARSLYNLASQGTGLGITRNFIDCYASLIRNWQPGDRIFLIGFSRGAYTLRCLAGVLRLCGVPTKMPDGSPLKRDVATSRKLAKEAVKKVYNYTNSRSLRSANERQKELLTQRSALAALYRAKYDCDGIDGGNARPRFVGVFDTVASLANPAAIAGLIAICAIGIAIFATAPGLIWGGYWKWFISLSAALAVGGFAANFLMRFRATTRLAGIPWYKTVHLASARMVMYDTELDPQIYIARHAISIDETRGSFERVKWGMVGQYEPPRAKGLPFHEQLWFAGNHSDIGGSYAEDESRLSDIALGWMVAAATKVGLVIDASVLRLYPDPTGMQHDESQTGLFKYAKKKPRQPYDGAFLHPSVLKRFALSSVLQYDEMKVYRPENLRNHNAVKHFYK